MLKGYSRKEDPLPLAAVGCGAGDDLKQAKSASHRENARWDLEARVQLMFEACQLLKHFRPRRFMSLTSSHVPSAAFDVTLALVQCRACLPSLLRISPCTDDENVSHRHGD